MKKLDQILIDFTVKKLQILVLTLLMVVSGSVSAIEVGEVRYSRGVLTGQLSGETIRIKGKGQIIDQGEVLSTGKNSFAIIRLNDGTRMTLRPNTVFKVDELNTNAGEENALLSLIRGGFRAVTGSISKRLAGAFKISTKVATIGIRGTEFDARICDESDCDAENTALASNSDATQSNSPMMIARVVRIKGNARATSADGRARALQEGAPIYERDRLNTGIKSYLVVAFNDESRVTLISNSELNIKQHVYKPEEPGASNSLLEFIRGGLRLVSGIIGKVNKDDYKIATPTATIGIRGTGFDLLCQGLCSRDADADAESGLFARVWEGSIELNADNDSLLLDTNQNAFMQNAQTRPRLISNIPEALLNMENTPRPDTIPFQPEWFSATELGNKIEAGLYVNVKEGIVSLQGTGEEIILTKQEAGKVSLAGLATRLDDIPGFQRFDKYPRPGPVTPRLESMLNLMGEDIENINEFECVVQ